MGSVSFSIRQPEKIKIEAHATGQLTADLGNFKGAGGTSDYNKLKNKPKVNHVELVGDIPLEDLGLHSIYYDTKANWNAQASMISERGAFYIYSDYRTEVDEVGNPTFYPGIKIGDGVSYLIDLPFMSDTAAIELYEHLADETVHISQAERLFWNNKVSSYLDANDTENLVLSKINYAQGDIYNG